jgi:hypothetical protein
MLMLVFLSFLCEAYFKRMFALPWQEGYAWALATLQRRTDEALSEKEQKIKRLSLLMIKSAVIGFLLLPTIWAFSHLVVVLLSEVGRQESSVSLFANQLIMRLESFSYIISFIIALFILIGAAPLYVMMATKTRLLLLSWLLLEASSSESGTATDNLARFKSVGYSPEDEISEISSMRRLYLKIVKRPHASRQDKIRESYRDYIARTLDLMSGVFVIGSVLLSLYLLVEPLLGGKGKYTLLDFFFYLYAFCVASTHSYYKFLRDRETLVISAILLLQESSAADEQQLTIHALLKKKKQEDKANRSWWAKYL